MGVEFHFNTLADKESLQTHKADVIIIATGGLPHTDILRSGNEHVMSTWDILSGDVEPGQNVLIFDDAGDSPALQAAEMIAQTGAQLEIMTPDRAFAPEIMAMNLVPFIRSLQACDVTFTVFQRLLKVRKEGNQLRAICGTDYSEHQTERRVDQVIVNHGTRPLDELYFDLKPLSRNRGEIDHEDFVAGRPQGIETNPDGEFLLFRIGDAVASRNTHAAIYDAIRLVKDL